MTVKSLLTFALLALSGIVAFLYLSTFAGILIFTIQTGSFIIHADSLMLVEAALCVWAAVVIGIIAAYALISIVHASQRHE